MMYSQGDIPDLINSSSAMFGPLGNAMAGGIEYYETPKVPARGVRAASVGLGGFGGSILGALGGAALGAVPTAGLTYGASRALGYSPENSAETAQSAAEISALAGALFGAGMGGLYGGRGMRSLFDGKEASYREPAAMDDLLRLLIKTADVGGRFTAGRYPAVTGPDTYAQIAFPAKVQPPAAQVMRRAGRSEPTPAPAQPQAPGAQIMRPAASATPRTPAPPATAQFADYKLPASGNYDDLVAHYDKIWWDANHPQRGQLLDQTAQAITQNQLGGRTEQDILNDYWKARSGGAGAEQLADYERQLLVSRSGGHMGNMSFNAASPNYGLEIIRDQLNNDPRAARAVLPSMAEAARNTGGAMGRFKTLVRGLF